MSFEAEMQAHLEKLIVWDRAYAAEAIRWYFRTCPWLESLIGPALREKWAQQAAQE